MRFAAKKFFDGLRPQRKQLGNPAVNAPVDMRTILDGATVKIYASGAEQETQLMPCSTLSIAPRAILHVRLRRPRVGLRLFYSNFRPIMVADALCEERRRN